MNQDNLNRTRYLTQLDIQIPSQFISEEIIETITTTEAQRSISPIQPKFTIPNLKKPNATTNNFTINSKILCCTKTLTNRLPNVSTSKKNIIQTSHKNNFAQHNYNFVNRPKTTKPSNMNTQNNSYSQSQKHHKRLQIQ